MHVLITGGHSGLGRLVTEQLCREGVSVSLVVRDESRLEGIGELRGAINEVFIADLGVEHDRARLCEEVATRVPRLTHLLNNAAVLLPERRYSEQGRELHFEVNTIAPLELMRGLRTLLYSNASREKVRVVNVVSDLMVVPGVEVFKSDSEGRYRKLFGDYMRSKQLLTYATAFLAERPEWFGSVLVSVTPGMNRTKMSMGKGMPWWLRSLVPVIFSRPEVGAARLMRALRDDVAGGTFLKKDTPRSLGWKMSEEDFVHFFGKHLL